MGKRKGHKRRVADIPPDPVKIARQNNAFEELASAAELGAGKKIDLHGLMSDEAHRALERFLHDSFMAGERIVRILHGRGRGILRQTAIETLNDHQLVDYYRDAYGPHAGSMIVVVLGER